MLTTSHVLWVSIVASTTVAAFTTLLIEYLAKPRLEARKERILDDNRQLRSALRGLQRAVGLTGQIIGLQDQHEDKIFNDRIIQYATEVERLLTFAWEEISVPRSLKEDWMQSTTAVVVFAALVQEGTTSIKEEAWEEVEMIARRLRQYALLFTTSRWRPRRRYVLMHQITQAQHR